MLDAPRAEDASARPGEKTRENYFADRRAVLRVDEVALVRRSTVPRAEAGSSLLMRLAVLLLAGQALADHAFGIRGWALASYLTPDAHDAALDMAWIVRFNQVDPAETADALARLVEEIDGSSSEPMRGAAALVLRILGDADSAARAD